MPRTGGYFAGLASPSGDENAPLPPQSRAPAPRQQQRSLRLPDFVTLPAESMQRPRERRSSRDPANCRPASESLRSKSKKKVPLKCRPATTMERPLGDSSFDDPPQACGSSDSASRKDEPSSSARPAASSVWDQLAARRLRLSGRARPPAPADSLHLRVRVTHCPAQVAHMILDARVCYTATDPQSNNFRLVRCTVCDELLRRMRCENDDWRLWWAQHRHAAGVCVPCAGALRGEEILQDYFEKTFEPSLNFTDMFLVVTLLEEQSSSSAPLRSAGWVWVNLAVLLPQKVMQMQPQPLQTPNANAFKDATDNNHETSAVLSAVLVDDGYNGQRLKNTAKVGLSISFAPAGRRLASFSLEPGPAVTTHDRAVGDDDPAGSGRHDAAGHEGGRYALAWEQKLKTELEREATTEDDQWSEGQPVVVDVPSEDLAAAGDDREVDAKIFAEHGDDVAHIVKVKVVRSDAGLGEVLKVALKAPSRKSFAWAPVDPATGFVALPLLKSALRTADLAFAGDVIFALELEAGVGQGDSSEGVMWRLSPTLRFAMRGGTKVECLIGIDNGT